jgi:hypothetical protein
LVLLALAVPWSAFAQTNNPRCNNDLIRGDFGFTIEGQKLGGPGPVGPQVGVAMTTFDGNGNLTQVDTVTIGGVLVADFSHQHATGTYTVNSDCTGTFTIHFHDGRPNVTVNFVVTQDGNEIDTVVIPPPPAAAGILATGSIGKRRFPGRE